LNRKARQKRLLNKILNNSKNLTNANKVSFLKRYNNGENFNTIKTNAIRKAQELAKLRKNKNEQNRLEREKAAENNRKAEENRLAKEKENQNAKNEANRLEKKRIQNQQQRLLSKILNNSKNLTNANKVSFLKRYNNGENFNTIKTNAIRKAQELAKLRKNKNEQNRLAREKANQNAKNEANRLAKEKANQNAKNEANRLAKEKANQNAKNEANRLAKEKANQNAKNEANRLAKEKANQNAKNEANRLALEMEGIESKRLWKEAQEKKEANRLAKEKANQNAKNEANRLAKEKANQNAKNEANRKAKEEEASRKEKEQKQKLLSKILNNSKNLTNTNKMSFLKRFEKGENFNTIKSNAIGKAKELAKQRKAKEEANRKAKEEEASRKEKEQKQKLLSKILNNSKNLTNTNKMSFLKRFEKGENFNTIKSNAIGKAKELTKQRKAKEEANRKAKEEEASRKEKEQKQKLLSKILNNSKNLTNTNKMVFLKRFEKGENFNTIKSNAIGKAKELAKQRKAKEEANRKAKEEEASRKEKEQKQKLLSKILNNSKNLTNTNKMVFLKRFEKGENFNTIKSNAIGKAKELTKQRKEKEEANRKAKEEMIAKKKEEALAKKKKEEEEKKKKEAENKKKAAQNTQMRASLTKKVKETQMDQKVKNKLLNQLKNYSVQIRNVAPGIEQTIESEKLNGNYNEAANKKKRQEVKKQLATYISTTYPNMSKADRKKYINSANLTQWRKGILTGSSGMGANQAFERIKGNMERNMKAKKPPPPPINKKANLKKLVNNTMKGRAAKNVDRLKKNINEGISEMAVKTRIAQLNKQTKYQK
jgi:hypothetical protein